jgi:hypothetical protein
MGVMLRLSPRVFAMAFRIPEQEDDFMHNSHGRAGSGASLRLLPLHGSDHGDNAIAGDDSAQRGTPRQLQTPQTEENVRRSFRSSEKRLWAGRVGCALIGLAWATSAAAQDAPLTTAQLRARVAALTETNAMLRRDIAGYFSFWLAPGPHTFNSGGENGCQINTSVTQGHTYFFRADIDQTPIGPFGPPEPSASS